MAKIYSSLTFKIILIFAAILTPIIFVFFLIYTNTRNHFENFIFNELKFIAAETGGDLGVFFDMSGKRMADFASDGFIRAELERVTGGKSKDGRGLGDYIARNKLPLEANLYRITVTSLGGRVVASTLDDERGTDVAQEEYFLKGKKGSVAVEVDNGYAGRPELAFSTPIYGSRATGPIGVLTGFMSFDRFVHVFSGQLPGLFIRDVGRAGRTMEAYIVNADRRMVTRSRFSEGLPLAIKVDTEPVNRCLMAFSGKGAESPFTMDFYPDYRGVEVAGAAVCLPSMGWTAVVEIDKDEALAPILNMRNNFLATLSVVMLVIAVVFLVISRSILRPLKELLLASKEIATGNYDIKVPVMSHDEIGALAWSFNLMSKGISERNLVLKSSEARLQALLDNTINIVYIKDREGRYLLINRRFETLFNVTVMEMIGRSDEDVFSPEMAAMLSNNDRVAFGSDVPIETEEIMPMPGGESRRYISVKFRIKDAHDKPYAICGVATDITDLSRTLDALKKSEASLVKSQRMAHVGSWDWDIVKNEFHCSDEIYNIFGLDRMKSELTYESFLGYVHPADRDFVKNSVAKSLETFRPHLIDHRIVLPGGDIRIVHTQGEIARDEANRAVMVSGTVQDITERKKAENEVRLLNSELEGRVMRRTEQLRSANKELEAFSYSVAHDLRAPLRIIDGFSTALIEDYTSKLDAEGRDHLRRVKDASHRMSMLIDDLLTLSSVIRAPLSREDIDLSALAVASAGELEKASPQRKVDCRISLGLKARADFRLMRVALDNLIGNAFKFTSRRPDGARIEFSSFIDEAGKTVYFVRDNGAGFDMKYASKLFGAFQRLHTSDDFSGTGIGLATVQRIINRHGGRIWAEGIEGDGATFYFTL